MRKNKKQVHPQKPPSMAWVGIGGINPDCADGLKRSLELTFENMRSENVG